MAKERMKHEVGITYRVTRSFLLRTLDDTLISGLNHLIRKHKATNPHQHQ